MQKTSPSQKGREVKLAVPPLLDRSGPLPSPHTEIQFPYEKRNDDRLSVSLDESITELPDALYFAFQETLLGDFRPLQRLGSHPP